ncbi:hypothetical protein SEUBUCD646_0M04440 [Saccharomyces eubayanus]|uniref:Uncharacterized protein n=1 Tax=Saccharomyces eubayanus TaxID=1080349 RepID=A0ABN8VLX2_SACEU|nr:hypothetical protein SEUBUCD650_0M04380 [Saccharomyces eubayanus]CAI1688359.1 hypothetical protein SEUBUCD646_0M04440 [Saccharomyces eubayanus]
MVRELLPFSNVSTRIFSSATSFCFRAIKILAFFSPYPLLLSFRILEDLPQRGKLPEMDNPRNLERRSLGICKEQIVAPPGLDKKKSQATCLPKRSENFFSMVPASGLKADRVPKQLLPCSCTPHCRGKCLRTETFCLIWQCRLQKRVSKYIRSGRLFCYKLAINRSF